MYRVGGGTLTWQVKRGRHCGPGKHHCRNPGEGGGIAMPKYELDNNRVNSTGIDDYCLPAPCCLSSWSDHSLGFVVLKFLP